MDAKKRMSFIYIKHWISFVQRLGDGSAETIIPVEIHANVKVCWEQFEALY